jgi:hypothetical protein
MTMILRDDRPRAKDARTSCGFCESTAGQLAGICHDRDGHCKGTWPHFVRATRENPEGLSTCACSAAAHPGRQVRS